MQNLNKKKQNHTSHITLHTSQKGITLIALIITIIVMLILVGVTINVALNGGLFDKADTATRQTEEKAILEEMLAMMDITDNGKINSDEIIKRMTVKYPTLKYDKSTKTATITGKLGTYNYIVSETEIKIGTKEIKTFDWEDVGLIVDTDTEYAISTGGIATFSEEGKMRVVDSDRKEILVIDATDSSKIKNGKIDYIGRIPGLDEDTNIKIRMNEEDENDEKIYVEVQGMGIITCEKVKEKTYPIAYSMGGNVVIIEISKTEAVFRGAIGTTTIVEVDSINKIEGFENEMITNEGNIEYTKVIVIHKEDDHKLIPAVYCEKNDAWYFVTNDDTIRNDISPMFLDTTTSKEDLEQIIQEERDKMNSTN